MKIAEETFISSQLHEIVTDFSIAIANLLEIRSNYINQRVITEIKTTPDGSAIVDETEILNEIQRFYAVLQKSDSEENSDVADFDAFTHELHLPKLSNAERAERL